MPWRRERLPTPVFWPGEFHGLYSPWGHKESDTDWLSHFTYNHFDLNTWNLHSNLHSMNSWIHSFLFISIAPTQGIITYLMEDYHSSSIYAICIYELTWWLSGKESACQCRRHGFNPWVREITDQSSILIWEIPWTEEDYRLQSMGSQRVAHDLATA